VYRSANYAIFDVYTRAPWLTEWWEYHIQEQYCS